MSNIPTNYWDRVMTASADNQKKIASERIKAGLKAARQRGKRLGTPDNLTKEARRRGSRAGNAMKALKAAEFSMKLLPIIQSIRAEGITSFAGIARRLEAKGIPNPRDGRAWWPNQVGRAIDRMRP
jgi:DNA invertase Pin-like site-specific DNA recombinase